VILNGIVDSDKPSTELVKDPCKVFYGTQMCYVFLRLHHTLFTRLSLARQLAKEFVLSADTSSAVASAPVLTEETSTGGGGNNNEGTASAATSALPTNNNNNNNNSGGSGERKTKPIYNHFLGQVFSLVEGTMDNARFEDFCRWLLGNKSYTLFTLDKIISQLMKHLQAMASDDNVTKLIGLFVYHHNHQSNNNNNSSNSTSSNSRGRGVDPNLYRQHVAHILSHTLEEAFRIQVGFLLSYCSFLVIDSLIFFSFLSLVPI
jgi:histone deacetylase complex regulatory component SIN3